MLWRVREVLYRAITTPRGDSIASIRVPKDLARRLNVTLGRPLASRDDLARRGAALARLDALRRAPAAAAEAPAPKPPVVVYCDGDRNARDAQRIEAFLAGKGVAFTRLDVGGDDATREFVLRRAGCDRDALPVVFVADRAIGGYEALTRSDGAELARLLDA